MNARRSVPERNLLHYRRPETSGAGSWAAMASSAATGARPDALWVSDLTYVWRLGEGFAYTALVIDAYARRIVGWWVSTSLHTDIAFDALEQALHERRAPREGLIHHSDRGVQYLSLRYTECLAQMGIAPSVGSVGDSPDKGTRGQALRQRSSHLELKFIA